MYIKSTILFLGSPASNYPVGFISSGWVTIILQPENKCKFGIVYPTNHSSDVASEVIIIQPGYPLTAIKKKNTDIIIYPINIP